VPALQGEGLLLGEHAAPFQRPAPGIKRRGAPCGRSAPGGPAG
jgi:hypothetical protein